MSNYLFVSLNLRSFLLTQYNYKYGCHTWRKTFSSSRRQRASIIARYVAIVFTEFNKGITEFLTGYVQYPLLQSNLTDA